MGGEVVEALRAVVAEPMLEKAAYVRTLSPAVRTLWQWVLAVCRELGVERGGEGGETAVAPAGVSAAAERGEEGEVVLIGSAAVRARARSKSQELAAPVSPQTGEGPQSPSSPASLQGTGVAPVKRRRSETAKRGRGLLRVESGKAGGRDVGGQTPSPNSAVSGGGGRSRAKREAVPSASSRSPQNVHLSVQAALKVRRKSTNAGD